MEITLNDIEVLEQTFDAKKAQISANAMQLGIFTTLMSPSNNQKGASEAQERIQSASSETIRNIDEKSASTQAKLVSAKGSSDAAEYLRDNLNDSDYALLIDCLESWSNRHIISHGTNSIMCALLTRMSGGSKEDAEQLTKKPEGFDEMARNEKDQAVLLKAKLVELKNSRSLT